MRFAVEENFVNEVVNLSQENDWEGVLAIPDRYPEDIPRKLLWVWPSKENLNVIKETVKRQKLMGVVSVGCGSGLLEWLLEQCTNLPVIGLEVNKGWWTSRYCGPQFIPLEFPEMPPRKEYLRDDYALLFCYFNNGPAFRDYVSVYGGNLVIIIGPGEGRGTHTNPEPFKPNLGKDWRLYKSEEVKNTKDFIAAYVRA